MSGRYEGRIQKATVESVLIKNKRCFVTTRGSRVKFKLGSVIKDVHHLLNVTFSFVNSDSIALKKIGLINFLFLTKL